MYLWQRLAGQRWWNANEIALRSRAGQRLAIIERPPRTRFTIEIACRSHREAEKIHRRFGGSLRKLPRDWLKRLARAEKATSIRIGNRLIISNVEKTHSQTITRRQQRAEPSHLFVPAGAAFGTGGHVTTAMSLRLLEQLTRRWPAGWSMLDLGTGSGILTLAGKRFGANRVCGIDIDSMALSTAKNNALLNHIRGIDFKLLDARRQGNWPPADVVSANLFSELLIEIVPLVANSRWLIASGVLRNQEKEVFRALKRNRFCITRVRRRGKWIALLATGSKTASVLTN